MIFEERTIYLHQTVKAGGKELYKCFDVSDAWRVMLEATNDQEVVELIVRRMDSNEARRISSRNKRAYSLR
jgi:hypothetical protein